MCQNNETLIKTTRTIQIPTYLQSPWNDQFPWFLSLPSLLWCLRRFLMNSLIISIDFLILFHCSEESEDPFNKDYMIDYVTLYVSRLFYLYEQTTTIKICTQFSLQPNQWWVFTWRSKSRCSVNTFFLIIFIKSVIKFKLKY